MKKSSDFPQILLFRGVTDMRKQSGGLAMLVEELMGKKPFDGSLFIFCNRQRDILKALYFDRAGFCLWTKKLDQGRFPWLRSADEEACEVTINPDDFNLLIDGVDIFKRHKNLSFQSIS